MTKRPDTDTVLRDQSAPQPDGSDLPRRDLLKIGAAGLGLAALGACAPATDAGAGKPQIQRTDLGPAPDQPFASPPMDLVRIGFVGVGGMGTAHVRNLLRIEGCHDPIDQYIH